MNILRKQPRFSPTALGFGPLAPDTATVWYCLGCDRIVLPTINPALTAAHCPHCQQEVIWLRASKICRPKQSAQEPSPARIAPEEGVIKADPKGRPQEAGRLQTHGN